MQDNELDPDDLILIEALVSGQTHSEAADTVGCSTKTVQRRMQYPTFAAAAR